MGKSAYADIAYKLWASIDRLTQDVIRANKMGFDNKNKGHSSKPGHPKSKKTRLLSPEEDVRKLILQAGTLDDIWQFFVRRLGNGTPPDLMCLSVMDESGDYIRVRYLHPVAEEVTFRQPIISTASRHNHLIQACQRKDTTFSGDVNSLGSELTNSIAFADPLNPHLNLFSVPLIAKDTPVAILTLGFAEMDSFSQAKLSYVYTVRDQIAQLVWNLVLQDRMQSQAQIDSLTGLLNYSYFQQVLDNEFRKADLYDNAVTVLLLDINNIQDINERLGHSAGDEAICHLASTVRHSIRGLDTVARHGGDEVVVILPESDPQTAKEIAERFKENLAHNIPAHLSDMSVSIGYATYPNDTKQKDGLLKLAEQALHLAKFRGSKTGESTCIASREIEALSEKTVLEVFASHVARKYNNVHAPSVYQELLAQIENKNAPAATQKQKNENYQLSRDALMLETITSLAGALDAKDRYTRGHSQAVANYAAALAHALKMSPEEVEQMRLAAFLHDIGKIGIPEAILCKKGPLNEKEWEIMKQHPVIGAEQILAPVTSLKPIIPAVLHHHENWDGSGHPHALKGEDIPIGARIVSIVDAFHALTSDRAYRKALPVAEAKKILDAGAGTKWDPRLIEVFFSILTIATPSSSSVAKTPAESAETEISRAIEQIQVQLQLPL